RIPRDDRADDADRLAPRVAQHVLPERDRLALEFAAEAAEIAEDLGGALGLGPSLGLQRVARLLGDDPRQFLDPGLDHVSAPRQDAAALAWRAQAPARKRCRRGFDGGVDILGAAARYGGDRLAVGGIEDGDRFTGVAVGPRAIDEHRFVAGGLGG